MKKVTIQSLVFLGMQTLSVCLGTMALGGVVYSLYRIVSDNLL